MTITRILLVAVVFAFAVEMPAQAGAGKAGLWEMKLQNKLAKKGDYPDISKLPPEMIAEFKRQGMDLQAPGGMTVKFCMTAQDVANNKPNFGQEDASCKPVNVKFDGKKYSADVVCTGVSKGKGHIDMTFASPEHYFGTQKMDVMEDGRMVHQEASMDARWLSANCGKIK